VTCEQNWGYEDCGQVENAKYQNYGCKLKDSETFEYFSCGNRMGKVNILFNKPPVPTKKAFQGINYNQLLDYNSTHIFCGERRISYEDFSDLYRNSKDICQLKLNKSVTLSYLETNLLTDFSFEFSDTLDEL